MKHFINIITVLAIAIIFNTSASASSDLALFDLKGPVKSVQTRQNDGPDVGFGLFMDNHSFTFSKDGSWKTSSATININGTPTNFSISRNSSGKIINLSARPYGFALLNIDISWNGGQVHSIRYMYDGDAEGTDEQTVTFTYSRGLISNMTYNSRSCEGDCGMENLDITVNNVNVDRYGNWTKRVLTLTGYSYDDYNNTKTRINKKVTQTRVITYW